MRIASRAPGFGVVRHAGRTAGEIYRTPVASFERAGERIIALTYGAESDWVRNVLAAGECHLETRENTLRLARPRIVVDPDNRWAPLPVRVILRCIGSTEHLRLDEVMDHDAGSIALDITAAVPHSSAATPK